MPKPLLFLDVDGVLNAIPYQRGPDQFDDFQQTRIMGVLITYSKKMGERIKALDADVVWLTTWQHKANEHIRHLYGWEEFPVVVAHPESYDSPWWKSKTAQRHLESSERPLIWIDDDLSYGERSGTLEWLREYSQPKLLICPQPTAGIRPSHLDMIEEWIKEHAN